MSVLKELFKLLGGYTGIARLWRKWGSRIMQYRLRKMLEESARTHELLSDLLFGWKDVGAFQVLLLRATNGGGLPRVGRPLYAGIIDVAQDHSRPPMHRDDFEARLLDDDYRRVLQEVVLRDRCHVETATMAEGSTLRTIYEARESSGSLVLKVGCQPDGFLYVSIGFDGRENGGKVPKWSEQDAERRAATMRRLSAIANEHLATP